MKLLTKEIEKKLEKSPYGSKDGMGMDAPLVVKFFNPSGAGTWLITEGEKQENGDWLLYGYCHIQEWEWVWLHSHGMLGLKMGTGEDPASALSLARKNKKSGDGQIGGFYMADSASSNT